jgi:7-carboxy-7-deazaguanine synthase
MSDPEPDPFLHGMLEISEMFSSIQGEGPFTGRPASFLRLSRCVPPLCPWCDTRHAWGPGKWISVSAAAEKILAHGNRLCVITGGEPFLQWESGLNLLEAYLIEKGITVQYETSGKVLIPSEAKGFKVCSPKYLSGTWQYRIENNTRADCFKFVVRDNPAHVAAFVKTHCLPETSVWIMPMGALRNEQMDRLAGVWRFCVDNRFNFSLRLHTLIFNNQKGV